MRRFIGKYVAPAGIRAVGIYEHVCAISGYIVGENREYSIARFGQPDKVITRNTSGVEHSGHSHPTAR